jgi:hypothetical protein
MRKLSICELKGQDGADKAVAVLKRLFPDMGKEVLAEWHRSIACNEGDVGLVMAGETEELFFSFLDSWRYRLYGIVRKDKFWQDPYDRIETGRLLAPLIRKVWPHLIDTDGEWIEADADDFPSEKDYDSFVERQSDLPWFLDRLGFLAFRGGPVHVSEMAALGQSDGYEIRYHSEYSPLGVKQVALVFMRNGCVTRVESTGLRWQPFMVVSKEMSGIALSDDETVEAAMRMAMALVQEYEGRLPWGLLHVANLLADGREKMEGPTSVMAHRLSRHGFTPRQAVVNISNAYRGRNVGVALGNTVERGDRDWEAYRKHHDKVLALVEPYGDEVAKEIEGIFSPLKVETALVGIASGETLNRTPVPVSELTEAVLGDIAFWQGHAKDEAVIKVMIDRLHPTTEGGPAIIVRAYLTEKDNKRSFQGFKSPPDFIVSQDVRRRIAEVVEAWVSDNAALMNDFYQIELSFQVSRPETVAPSDTTLGRDAVLRKVDEDRDARIKAMTSGNGLGDL